MRPAMKQATLYLHLALMLLLREVLHPPALVRGDEEAIPREADMAAEVEVVPWVQCAVALQV